MPVRWRYLLVGVNSCVLVLVSGLDTAVARSHCDPGTLNAAGTCDCPAGYRLVVAENGSHCAASTPPPPATCGVPGKPECKSSTFSGTPVGDAGALVAIKGGTFFMGDAGVPGGGPAHSVGVSDFAIDKYETSVGEYKRCVDSGTCTPPPAVLTGVINANRCNYATSRVSHPMNCVTWQEAQNYCLWKGKRLPTESEWEYAARGATGRPYPWGRATPTCKHANFLVNVKSMVPGCGDGTSSIGSHSEGRSERGAHDLAGNVAEWVWDWYGLYSGFSGSNTGGPATGLTRVVKGSAWDSDASALHSARREGVDPSQRESWVGFRCAQGPSPSITPSMYTTFTTSATPTLTPGTGATAPVPTEVVSPAVGASGGPMLPIPGGSFRMGNNSVAESAPEHGVTLSPYFIDTYEVSVDRYRECVNSGSCSVPSNHVSPNCSYDSTGSGDRPVNCVEWSHAQSFCAWAGKRLPTEAEWEFAARGSDARAFPWGPAAPTCGHAAFRTPAGELCSGQGASRIGAHPLGVSLWGVHDLAGNMEEWVADAYAPYGSTATVNPRGPSGGTMGHVVRGGSWETGTAEMRTYSRFHFEHSKYWVGFRCAKN